MDRRDTLKLLMAGALSPAVPRPVDRPDQEARHLGRWHDWPDVRWVGPDYWGNRLQDWEVRGGVLVCRTLAPNRTLHCLTHRAGGLPYRTDLVLDASALRAGGRDARAGVRVGSRGRFPDFRSAAVHGRGEDAGVDGEGRLVCGDLRGAERIDLAKPIRLQLNVEAEGAGARLTLHAFLPAAGAQPVSTLEHRIADRADTLGTLALHVHSAEALGGAEVRFDAWSLYGPGILSDPEAAFGPIVFAQYTLHRNVLKLTAQLAPIEAIDGLAPVLQVRTPEGTWTEMARAPLDPLARTARFRVEHWDGTRAVPYRVRVRVPLRSGPVDFVYEGTVAAEPDGSTPLKAAVFSCNADHGFPDAEVVRHVSRHRPDLALFLGDQFYESSGGFGIQTDSVPEATLDMLHKWFMFGWSYRELFRHVPAAFIPDDHDVYHGNVWGEGGKVAPTDHGWGAEAQDQGGYKMPAAWLNAVQRAQTSHLPDPVDPVPVDQGIGVYFTSWTYGGISFAILEDRKFKSAPANVLPAQARVWNGWIQNPDFDVREHRDLPDATLLGTRQMHFLRQWAADWSGGAQIKVVLSQTNFAAVHTIPADALTGEVIPSLPVPRSGEYVDGDKPAVDMDSNGWPQDRRDEVLRVLRTCSAFHIAGDQHLATMVHHGVDEFRDAAWSFTGPALNNIWPRRWWPPRPMAHSSIPGQPPYTGDFLDGFGNRITVYAAANPHDTGLEPRILRDRATGYGIITFDPTARTIRIECWPRQSDPAAGDAGQYRGWPMVVGADAGDGRVPALRVPLRITGLAAPVLQVRDAGDELVYSRRVEGSEPAAPLFSGGRHQIRVGDPDRGLWQERTVDAEDLGGGPLSFDFEPDGRDA
ncbi:MAG: alkaline phosphatase D family protein [Gemmatimonadota bacterium]